MPMKGVHTMPGATPSYPPEFKREAVRLVRSSPDRSVAQIARELGVSDNSLRSSVKQTEIDQGEREGLSTEEREELRVGFAARIGFSSRRKRSSEKPRPFSPGRTGSGEIVQVHRCGEGQLPDLAAVPDTEGLKERLLRLEGSLALQKKP